MSSRYFMLQAKVHVSGMNVCGVKMHSGINYTYCAVMSCLHAAHEDSYFVYEHSYSWCKPASLTTHGEGISIYVKHNRATE